MTDQPRPEFKKNLFSRFSSMPLGKKTMFLFMLIFAVYIILFMLIYLFLIRNNLSDYAAQKNRDAMHAIAGKFAAQTERMDDISTLIMIDEPVGVFLRQDINQAKKANDAVKSLENILDVFEGISSVYIFQMDGTYVNAIRDVATANTSVFQSEDWKAELLKKEGDSLYTLNGNGLFEQKNRPNILTFLRIIYDKTTGESIGYLAINLPLSFLDTTYQDLRSDNSQFGYLYAEKYLCGDNITTAYSAISSQREQYGRRVAGNLGDERILSYYRIEGTDLTIVSKESFYAGENMSAELTVLIVSMLAVTIASVVLVSAFISFYITKPIKSLVQSMDSVAETGGLHKASLSLPDDEIGNLKNRYNMMLDEIDSLFKELIAKENKIRSAEISIVHEQIKPHFLYNTLDTIAYMAAEAKDRNVYEAICTLASFFKNFLSSGNIEVPIKTELQIVKDYLKLQKYRYGDIFDDEYDVDRSLLDVQIPKLILQPLVENALYHGVRVKGEKCVIRISIQKKNNLLEIVVYDSGVGMSEEKIRSVLHPDENDRFGLTGTIERLRYFSKTEDVIDIQSEVGAFTSVRLRFPLPNE